MNWKKILLVVIVAIIIFVLVWLAPMSDRYLKRTSVAPGPGDIMAVAGNGTSLIRMFIQSHWTHVALVLPTRQGLVVAEVQVYRNTDRPKVLERGFWTYPLDEWIQKNAHRGVAVAKYTGPPFNPVEVERILDQYRGTTVGGISLDLLRYLQPRPHRPSPVPGEIMCAGLTMRLLQELGRAEKRYDPTSYDPAEILHGRFHTVDCHYAPPRRLET